MTHIGYPNLTAVSASGEFRVEITGQPEHAYFRDQSHFSYRLYRANVLQWTWTPNDGEDQPLLLDDFPHEAWVNDDGWVVVRTHDWFFAGLLVLSPLGEVIFRQYHRGIFEDEQPGFLDGEPENYMGNTSAGPFWASYSLAYFFQSDGRPCWAIRTWWGFRVIIDLQNGTLVSPSELDSNLLESQELALALASLRDNLPQLEAASPPTEDLDCDDDRFWKISRAVRTAAYQAGWLRSEAFVPYLRRLEQTDAVGGHSSGRVDGFRMSELTCRHIATLSLLRLDQQPLWLPHYQFQGNSRSPRQGESLELPICGRDWSPEELQPGLTQLETLTRFGAPDFIRDDWEYDFFSSSESYTLRIGWETPQPNLPPRIEKIEVVAPQWREITMRDLFLT